MDVPTPRLHDTRPRALLARATARASSAHGCARPNCFLPPVVTFDWAGMVQGFCATHAGAKLAEEHPPAILWMDSNYQACDTCGRILARALFAQGAGHFDTQGLQCLGAPATV